MHAARGPLTYTRGTAGAGLRTSPGNRPRLSREDDSERSIAIEQGCWTSKELFHKVLSKCQMHEETLFVKYENQGCTPLSWSSSLDRP